jgi:hypothetical protein
MKMTLTSLETIRTIFPAYSAMQLVREAVEANNKPMLEMILGEPELRRELGPGKHAANSMPVIGEALVMASFHEAALSEKPLLELLVETYADTLNASDFAPRQYCMECMELIGKETNIDDLVLSVKKELLEEQGFYEQEVYKNACSFCKGDIMEDTGYQCGSESRCTNLICDDCESEYCKQHLTEV